MKRKRTRQHQPIKRSKKEIFDIDCFLKDGFSHIGAKIFECLDDQSFVNCKLVCKSWLQFIDNRRSSWLREVIVLKDHVLSQDGHLIYDVANAYNRKWFVEIRPRKYYRHKLRFLSMLDQLIVRSRSITNMKSMAVFLRKIVRQWYDVEIEHETDGAVEQNWTLDDIFQVFVKHGIDELAKLVHQGPSSECLKQEFVQDLLTLQFQAAKDNYGDHHFKLMWTLLQGTHMNKLSEMILQSTTRPVMLESLQFFQLNTKLAFFGDGLTELDYFKTLYELCGNTVSSGLLFSSLSFEVLQYVVNHVIDGPLTKSNLSRRDDGKTLLHHWITKDFEHFHFLASKWDGDKNPKSEFGVTPLHVACRSQGHEEAIEYVLKHVRNDSIPQDTFGNSPLHEAAKYGLYDNFKLVYSKFTEKNPRNSEGMTPLQMACIQHFYRLKHVDRQANQEGQQDIVRYIVKRLRCDFNPKDENGNTPLHEAAKWGKFESFKLIASKCSEINPANNQGVTPMHNVCRATPIGMRLMPDTVLEMKKQIQEGKKDIIGYIMNHARNDVNPKDNDGNTPLHDAAKYGNYESYKRIASKCTVKNPKNHQDVTPLHLAANLRHCLDKERIVGRFHIFHHIVDFEERVDDLILQDSNGNTPVHEAVQNDGISMDALRPEYFLGMLYTIAESTTLDTLAIKNANGQTPLDVVDGKCKSMVRRIFKEHCSKSKPKTRKKGYSPGLVLEGWVKLIDLP